MVLFFIREALLLLRIFQPNPGSGNIQNRNQIQTVAVRPKFAFNLTITQAPVAFFNLEGKSLAFYRQIKNLFLLSFNQGIAFGRMPVFVDVNLPFGTTDSCNHIGI